MQATKQLKFFFDTCSRRGGPRKRGMETQTSQVAKGEYVTHTHTPWQNKDQMR